MSTVMIETRQESSWLSQQTYDKVNEDISNNWPQWKKEVYNEMFAVSAHAGKIVIKK